VARALRRGSLFGKYRLERRLGSGAVGDVWKARDTVERRPVALKIITDDAVRQFGRSQLEREAQVAARLRHPNIVELRNADWIEGRLVLATELAMCNLASYAGARRSGTVALRVIRDVVAGLAHAHGQRVMHRDVKPENILIFAGGRAALADFGEWRLAEAVTRAHTEAGTLGYMAPEQAYGRPTLASDVFSLGLIAYESLTGVLPAWPFPWPPEGYRRFAAKVPDRVVPVLRRAAEFEPRRRYSDAIVLRDALEAAVRRAADERRPARSRKRRRKPAPTPSPLELQAELFRRRHGARLGMRYRCHRCNGAISEAMLHCPWCGSADNSLLEVSEFPLVCPDCERGVRPEWRCCPWCYRGRFESNGRAPPTDPRAERRCTAPGCEGQLRPFMRYCPLCKRRPLRLWTDPELSGRCPRCRWSVSTEAWRFCPWCGRREPKAGAFERARA
jgi:serine/threonine-protein kinase